MLITSITFKLFKPGNKGFTTQRTVAKKGTHFTAANIEQILSEFIDKVEAAMPGLYRLVPVGQAAFNIVRITQPEDQATPQPDVHAVVVETSVPAELVHEAEEIRDMLIAEARG